MPVGVVTTIAGPVSIVHGTDTARLTRFRQQRSVFAGDRIVTGEQAVIRIIIGTGVATLRGRATLTIARGATTGTVLTFTAGHLAYALRRGRQGETHEIRTPNAVVTAHNTVIDVDVRNDAESRADVTRICVHAGNATAAPSQGIERPLRSGECVTATGDVLEPRDPPEWLFPPGIRDDYDVGFLAPLDPEWTSPAATC